jgi:ribonuclease Z
MIDVMLLGTGAMVPLPDRWLSSALLRTGRSLILLDCGEGTQIAMRERHWGFRRLTTICLSHLHADHCAGLPGLFHTVANAGKRSPLAIYGPPGTSDAVNGLRAIAPHLPFEVTVTELTDGATVEGPEGVQITVAEGEHRVSVLAYRFDRPRQRRFRSDRAVELGVPMDRWSELQAGRTVVVDGRTVEPGDVLGEHREGVALGFATDTRPIDDVRNLVHGVDLLISEATFGDDADIDKAIARGHMTFREAATLARDAEARHLWLTHFSAALEDPEAFVGFAADVMPEVTVGYAGLSATLAFEGGYRADTDANLEDDDRDTA